MFSFSKEEIDKMIQTFNKEKAINLKKLEMKQEMQKKEEMKLEMKKNELVMQKNELAMQKKETEMQKKELETKEFNVEDFLKQQEAEKDEEEIKSDNHYVFHFFFDLLKFIIISLVFSLMGLMHHL